MSRFTFKLRDLENQPRDLDTQAPLLSADGHEPPAGAGAATDAGPSPTGADSNHLGVTVKSPLSVKLHVEKHGEVVTAKGSLGFDYERPCDRCGENLPFHLDEKISFLLRRETTHTPAEPEPKKGRRKGRTAEPESPEPSEEDLDSANRLSPSDLDDMTYSGDSIDFEPFLYEVAALGIPMRTVCEDSGKTCQIDPASLTRESRQETDPRWAALKALKKS